MDCDDDFSVLLVQVKKDKFYMARQTMGSRVILVSLLHGCMELVAYSNHWDTSETHLEHLETVVFGVLFEPALYLSWYSRDLNVVFYNVAKMTIPWTQLSSAFKSSQFSSFSAEIQFKVNLQMWRWVLFFEMGTCMQIWCKYSLAGRGGFTKFIQL